ncbi:MAG: DUF4920 domain-containing protein [Gammaproteobacteria bacterium]
MRLLVLLLTALAFNAQAEDTALRLSEPVEATDAYEVFGAPMADKNSGLTLKEIIAGESDFTGQEVRVSTRIAKVCQKKGCFFVATEGEASARVTFADYGFFIPTDSGGKQVTMVGTFSRKAITPEQAAHYTEDLGEPAGETDPSAFEYSIVATSVLIPRS